MSESFKPKAYLRVGCPYSFKLLLFLSEARLLGTVELIRCDPNTGEYEQVKARVSQATGKPTTFPTVEVEPGLYQSDSDALIEHFARKHGVDPGTLTALVFYRESIFPQLEKLH